MRLPSRWVIRGAPDDARVEGLSRALNLPMALAALLVQRGYHTPDAAATFLRPDLGRLIDPFQLPDMSRAVELLAGAVRRGEGILVHGDYDVDGQCASALLTRTLRAAGARVIPFVPHRVRDGYDFGPAGLAAAQEHRAAVIVTCDCGTTAHEAVARAKAAGHTVIITDHHLPGALPPADAIVNPRREDGNGAYRDFCGAGVAFKLAQGLVGELGLPSNLPYYLLDLVALATVADIVPLTGENRILVKSGLKLLADSPWPGVRALVETVGLAGKAIRAGHVGFILAPRLNATGRIADAMDGLKLLLSDDAEEARELARRLETINARRQAMDQEILAQAVGRVEREVDLQDAYGLVLAQDGWHPGVIGIVASRLVERFGRPTILVALEGDEGRGSGRSIPGFDLHAALVSCAPHLARFGGHTMAAGLTVRRDRLDDFRLAFNAVARGALKPDDLVPTQRIDLLVALDQLDLRLERLLQALEPCGSGNPAPVFGAAGVKARDPKVVGANHLRFVLDDGTGRLPAIGFDWADRVEGDWAAGPVDVAFRLDRDDWMGDATLQARVVHIRPSSVPTR
ncbi:MAG: single-stranded-DNA-specific exonuclease RecJ [Gemmatimonadetes bacterium RIFCSPLOWO2_12_FULL_68_9]|nr:MAG: single-stranded-DNA-specific exonuclease RecJ [Gemmatimonadetes bacterium RIFCSPLOWO2_12_FULL_68_9]